MRRMGYLLISLSIIALDRGSKYAVVAGLAPGESVGLLPGVLHISRVHNTGSAFGLFQGHNSLFLLVSGIVTAGLLLALLLVPLGRLGKLGIALTLGGAAGNLIDRALWGHVVDFIDLRFWPSFNLADAATVVGALLLALGIIVEGK